MTTTQENKMLSSSPSNLSPERMDRIMARRKRIENTLEQKRRMLNPESEQRESGELGSGEKTQELINDSTKRFREIIDKAIEEVINIRATTGFREQTRKTEVENRREELKQKAAGEKEEAERINEEIQAQWKQILSKQIPQELYEAIQETQSICNDVLASQNAIIAEYVKEIKAREDDFVRALSRQAEDVDSLIQNMRNQYKKLSLEYINELQQVEDSFQAESNALRAAYNEELEKKWDERRLKEQQYAEMKQERSEEFKRHIDELHVQQAEEYNELKIRLETEIQTLEQHLQEMKATYQLNNEKLVHNFRVLDERDIEHTQAIQLQKKKINRLQDMLSTLKAKYAKTDKKYKQRNIELTEEYKRITEQYKELQSKFKHFQDRDKQKYKDIWVMNEERAALLVKKVMQADKVITEQQLEFQWFPPKEDIFKQIQFTPEKPLKALKTVQRDSVLFSEKMKKVVEMICNEAGFLVEDKVKDLLDGLDKDEQNLIKINSILSALGVDSSDTDTLIQYFVKTNKNNEQKLISEENVITALKAFVNDHQYRVKQANMEEMTSTEEKKKEKIERQLEKEFWERLANVIPPEKYQAWLVLEKELVKYNAVLTDRANLLAENNSIRKQNEELKMLLNQYLTSKVNEELIHPPITITN